MNVSDAPACDSGDAAVASEALRLPSVQWDLSDRLRRRDFYEIVLVKGTLDDICAFVNGPELVRLWDEMYLPPWVSEAWGPLLELGNVAA